jgi:hypothetical protein
MDLTKLHDWEITGIHSDRGRRKVEITLLEPIQNIEALLLLNGVKRFFASGMMMQNVILDVLLFEDNTDSDYFRHCKNLLNLKETSFDGLCLVYLEPTVGIEVACYCESIECVLL